MSQSYIKAIEENLGHVDIVFDRYRISAFANRAIDELLKDLQVKLDKKGKNHPKRSKFLFLQNFSNLTDNGKAKLQVLLDANKSLFFMYNMNELLRYFWMFKIPNWQRGFCIHGATMQWSMELFHLFAWENLSINSKVNSSTILNTALQMLLLRGQITKSKH